MTDDSLPRFHHLARNVGSFNGYNGRDIAPVTVFGRELARLVSGEIREADLPLPVTEPEPPRYRMAKEAYCRIRAQVAHVAGVRF